MITDRYISGLDIRAGMYVMPMTPTVGLPNHRQLKGRYVTSGFAESADTEAPELCASVNAYYIPRLQVRYFDWLGMSDHWPLTADQITVLAYYTAIRVIATASSSQML